MTKLKARIRNALEPEIVEFLESEPIVKIGKAFPGVRIVYAQRHEHQKIGND
tara:strand:- start:118 stop:273 length:156 start_codon:yes stop_codon:yes gene_type:complete